MSDVDEIIYWLIYLLTYLLTYHLLFFDDERAFIC